MPRTRGITVDNNFINGLITEAPALSFPEKACTETYNCVFTRTGRVTRRLGIDVEPSYVVEPNTVVEDQAIAEYMWSSVAGVGTISILVQQWGSKLHFYNVSDTASVSSQKRVETITLADYLPSGSSKVPAVYPCAFAQGNGDLLVVNEAISPFYVQYNPDTDVLTATAITLKQRDFAGLDDGLELSERLTSTVASLKTSNPEHYYNLLNQGWYGNSADALTQWDVALTTVPSNADVPALFRASETDTFDSARVSSKDPGNVPAPKGHFILTAWDQDRSTAMTDEGFTGATITTGEAAISYSEGSTLFGSSWTNAGGAFDGTTSGVANTSVCANWGTVNVATANQPLGKTYGSGKKITKAIVYGSSNEGFIAAGSTASVTLTLYGKQGAAPSAYNDGTVLGSTTFSDTSNESSGRTITSSDTTTAWDHVWINLNSSQNTYIAEITFYTVTTSSSGGGALDLGGYVSTYERPCAVGFYAGRAWYAGILDKNLAGTIYFSQIIENRNQYGLCYQKNDPAGEYYNELLPDDGGVIKILEMGQVVKLFASRSSLLVFATNGVWAISGSQGQGFKATDFFVRKISSVGTSARLSFVDFKGLPLWWAEDGIYAMKYDASYDSYDVENIALNTIKSFFFEIPVNNRRDVKGAYDYVNDFVYWVYADEAVPVMKYAYDHILVLNGKTGAFFPWAVGEQETNAIRGLVYVKDATLTSDGRIKYGISTNWDATDEDITYAEFYKTTYEDWGGTDYDSYFITGYKIHGDTQRFVQPNYVFVFLDTEADSSLYMQAVYDFTNSGDSGKWSTKQQCYNSSLTYRDVNFRRLKVRGKGRSLQFKFIAEPGKPFSVIGWSVNESQNQGV